MYAIRSYYDIPEMLYFYSMQIIFEQILILSLICVMGIIAFRLKAISKDNSNGLVKVILKITLPLLIFTTFAGTKLNIV